MSHVLSMLISITGTFQIAFIVRPACRSYGFPHKASNR